MRIRGRYFRVKKEITKEDRCINYFLINNKINYNKLKLGKVYIKKLNNIKLNEYYILFGGVYDDIKNSISLYIKNKYNKNYIDYIDKKCLFNNRGFYFKYNNKYFKYIEIYGQGMEIVIQRVERPRDIKNILNI